jgi:hypothetical protein
MFKIDSFELELMKSMSDNLLLKVAEEKSGINRLNKAVDYLNSAASIFEKSGMIKEAEEITKIISSLNKL